jgi:hypothetical protein
MYWVARNLPDSSIYVRLIFYFNCTIRHIFTNLAEVFITINDF